MGYEPGGQFLPLARSRHRGLSWCGRSLVQDTGLTRLMRPGPLYRHTFIDCLLLVPMATYYLGIDVSKGYADFVLIDQRKRLVEAPFQLDDTFEGHHGLYHVLRHFLKDHPTATFRAAVESTGGYENNWLNALGRFQGSLPLKATRLNPARVADHARAEGCRTTTDVTSAYYVASYLVAYPEKITYQQHERLATLRAQWTFIAQLKKQRTALLNQLESVLYRAHPEVVAFLTGSAPAWLLKLLVRYPTAKRLGRARAKTLAQIPYLTCERAEGLIEQAQRSVASATDVATEHLVRELARQVLHLSNLISRQEQVLAQELALPDEIELLKSFGNIGTYTAVGMLLEIESVERFASAKKMAAFFGVPPVFKVSGDGIGQMRMSKQGSARMRALLYMVTLGAMQDHPIIAPLYKRLVEEEGKEKMVAIGVCMHKTLRILYGLLKHRQAFDPELDRRHRSRSCPEPPSRLKQPATPAMGKRRYQSYDEAAPISRRAKKRRRSQKGSQGASGTKCGMPVSTTALFCQRGKRRTSSVKEQRIPT